MPSRASLALLAVVAVLATACGPSTATSATAEGLEAGEDGWRGTPLEREREMPEATLTDTDGERFELATDTRGRPTLLFFGYTSCPDVCPIHMGAIADGMESTGIDTDQVQVVFVSVDPERDTRERIAEFLANFDDTFVGLRGEEDVIEGALDELDLPGPTNEGHDPRGDGEGQLIGHPAQVIGFDAEGEARRVWPFGARRSDWSADLPRIVEDWA